MVRRHRPGDRDRGLRQVRLWTGATALGAAGLTGAVAGIAATSFRTPVQDASSPARVVPRESPPVQSAPPTPLVITRIVHTAEGASGSLRPPAAAPAAPGASPGRAAPPPPPPACHSTPSRPC